MSWKGWCSYYFCLYLMRIFPTINPIKKLVLCWSCSIQLVSSTTSELHSMGVTSIRRLICLRRFSDSGFVWKTESLKYIMVYPVFIARTMLHSELPPTFCDLEQLHNTHKYAGRLGASFHLNWASHGSFLKKPLTVLTGLFTRSSAGVQWPQMG